MADDTAGKYTKPSLRDGIKSRVMASSDGGKPGQWSARKAQLVAQKYESAGGGYSGAKTESQKSLSKWTDQKWKTSDGKPAERKGGTTRYLPEKAWDKLSPSERSATNAKKREGSREGEQFVKNTEAAAEARSKVAVSVDYALRAFENAAERGDMTPLRNYKRQGRLNGLLERIAAKVDSASYSENTYRTLNATLDPILELYESAQFDLPPRNEAALARYNAKVVAEKPELLRLMLQQAELEAKARQQWLAEAKAHQQWLAVANSPKARPPVTPGLTATANSTSAAPAAARAARGHNLLKGLAATAALLGTAYGVKKLHDHFSSDKDKDKEARKEAMDKYEKQASTAYMRYLQGLAPSEQIPTMMGVLQRATGHGYHSLQEGRQWPQGTLRDRARKANRQNIRKALRSPVDPLAGRLPGRFIPDLSEFAEKISSTGAWQRSEGKNPEGGLNAKGRASLKAQGHDIKPGVKGPADTPEKLKRKGSFLSRMFGPGAPGSMKKDNGEPSRRALSAKAWGEAVPSDDAGRARLYAKGQSMLNRYGSKKEANNYPFAVPFSGRLLLKELGDGFSSPLGSLRTLPSYVRRSLRHKHDVKIRELALDAAHLTGALVGTGAQAGGLYHLGKTLLHSFPAKSPAADAIKENAEDHAVKTVLAHYGLLR